jgi:cytoskeletal protein CcmA (bactofilin family)
MAKGLSPEVVVPNDYPKFLKWMPEAKKNTIADYKRKKAAELIESADVIFILDFNAPHRAGDMVGKWIENSKAKKILIDHHQQPDTFDYVYSDTTVPATCQMVYHFIEALGEENLVNKEIAECLYCGIMTDTGGFRFRSTSATTHRIIAKLIEKGADPAEITSNTWDTNTVSRLKLLSLILLASVTNFSCIQTKNGSNDVMFSHLLSDSGKGDVIEKSYSVDFDELQISTSLSAEVFKSNVEKIVVYAPSDLMKYVVVKQEGRKVKVKIQSEGKLNISTDRIKIKVYAKDFDGLVANSSGSIVLKDDFKFSDLDVKVSSSGNIKGNINGNNINIQTSSSGEFYGEVNATNLSMQSSSSGGINIKGKVERVSAQASSSGDIKAENLTADSAVLTTSSSADITIGVRTSLTASASSSGDIDVVKRGDLSKVSKNESSSGTINIR